MTNKEKILSLKAVLMLTRKNRRDVEQGIYYNTKTGENIWFLDAVVNVQNIIQELEESEETNAKP